MNVVKKFLISNYLFLILIISVGIYLAIKAMPEKSWDGWRCCSAQTLLSDKHWVNDGFIKNYFLFLPQGYSKIVRYFDDPELRHHAKGIATGGLIGRRLYYTHYPSGYLLPTAILMKLGFQNRFWFRFLEILFSLFGFLILYLIFNIISSDKIIAFLGVLFYGISILFINYADSLANQPLDEMLRFVIICLSIIALQKPQKKYFKYFIWLTYFALSISSYDSTFFIFAWLAGLDIIVKKKIDWQKLFFWATAPILAFGLQTVQNIWYLGWHDMLLDFYGTFKSGIVGSRKNFFISHLQRLTDPFDWFFNVRWYLGIAISILGIWCLKFIKKYLNTEILDIRYLYLAFMAILFNFLFFPSLFFYQARIIAVFGGFLIGSLTILAVKEILRKDSLLKIRVLFLIILIVISGIWLVQAKRTYAFLKQWPNNVWPQEKIDFDKQIRNLVSSDKVIFKIFKLDAGTSTLGRYPTSNPEDEYYTESPILGFTKIDDLIKDLTYLKKRSEFPFNSIIIGEKKDTVISIKEALAKLQIQKMTQVSSLENYFIFIVSE